MTDLYPLKENLTSDFFNLYTIIYLIISLLLAIIFLFFYSPKKKIIIEKPPLIIKSKKGPQFYLNLLEKLAKNNNHLNSFNFYQELNDIIKNFTEEETEQPFSKMTLTEIKKYKIISQYSLKKINLFTEILEKTYFPEFDNQTKDSTENRKIYINKIKSYLEDTDTK